MKDYSAANYQAAMDSSDPRMEELDYLQARLGPASDLLPQSQPLTGSIMTEQGPMEVADALDLFVGCEVLYRFGTWVVTEEGVGCLVHRYPLSYARLHEQQDWERHLAEQSWANLWDALRALTVARHISRHSKPEGPHGDAAHPS